MRFKRITSLLALASGLVLGSVCAQAQKAPLTVEDRLQIAELYNKYSVYVDFGGPEDASVLFTADGTFDSRPTGTLVAGQAALKDFYSKLLQSQLTGNRKGLLHVPTNVIIVNSSEGAKGSSYLMTIDTRDRTKLAGVVQMGRYEDTFVKTSDGWRIKHRKFTQDFQGPGNVPPPAQAK